MSDNGTKTCASSVCEWRIQTAETRLDDHARRLRAIETRLAWIAGGLALLALEIPAAIGLARVIW